jgi:CHAT domain-containing protein
VSPPHHARLLLEKAEVLATLGAHGEALASADGALAVAEARGLEAERARGLLVRARCLLATGDPDGAAAMTAASLERAKAMKDARGVRAAALAGAEVALARGDAARATEFSILAASEGASMLDRARAGASEARARLFAGDASAGLARAEEARALASTLAVPTVEIDAWCAVAACARAIGSTDEAIAALESAVAAAERLRGTLSAERHRTAFAASRVRAYEELALDLLARGDAASIERAFLTVERARSRLLLDTVLRAIDRGGDVAASEPELAALRTKLAALHAARFPNDDRDAGEADATRRGPAPAHLAAMQATEDAIDAVVTRARVRSGGLASLFAEPLETAAIRATLGEGDALVSYFACGDELLAFVATRDAVVPVRAIGSMREIDALVEKTLFRLRGAARRGEDERRTRTTTALLAALHDALVAPVLGAVPVARDARRLVLVPFGSLHAVPFAALRGHDHWLVERYELAVAPSASLACVPADGTRSDAVSDAAPMLVVGVADEVAPRIDAEVEAIARSGRCEVLAGAGATIEVVREAVRDRRTVHFACHGRFLPSLPAASGIRLADGWMPVREIVALPLDAELVFLSACESGRHAVDAGEELCGIARAFLAAGARRVVTSLWPVRDAAAEAVATGYHTAAGAGKRPSAALRDSMLATMRFLPHPCDWAAFTVSGGL